MPERLALSQTHALFIGGVFVPAESGQMIALPDGSGGERVRVCRAGARDLDRAVDAARSAFGEWSREGGARTRCLYSLAESLEGGRFAETLDPQETDGGQGPSASDELAASIDRLVAFAGWCDTFQQVLGCQNPVAGPYHCFTTPEPIGVAAIVAPDDRPLLGLVSLLAPALAAGNTAVCLASEDGPLSACVFAEACAAAGLPAGVVNVLTGTRAELIGPIADHGGINAVHAANVGAEHARVLRAGMASNFKRVTVRQMPGAGPGGWFDAELCESPRWIEPLVEMKTVWHPRAT